MKREGGYMLLTMIRRGGSDSTPGPNKGPGGRGTSVECLALRLGPDRREGRSADAHEHGDQREGEEDLPVRGEEGPEDHGREDPRELADALRHTEPAGAG